MKFALIEVGDQACDRFQNGGCAYQSEGRRLHSLPQAKVDKKQTLRAALIRGIADER
jgi:hypothetical protein